MIMQANTQTDHADFMEKLRERDPKFFALLHDPEFVAAVDRMLRPLLTPVFGAAENGDAISPTALASAHETLARVRSARRIDVVLNETVAEAIRSPISQAAMAGFSVGSSDK